MTETTNPPNIPAVEEAKKVMDDLLWLVGNQPPGKAARVLVTDDFIARIRDARARLEQES